MLVPTPGQPRRDDTRSLWNQPVDTAEFLGLLSFGESGRIGEVIGLQQQQQREFPVMAGRLLPVQKGKYLAHAPVLQRGEEDVETTTHCNNLTISHRQYFVKQFVLICYINYDPIVICSSPPPRPM